MFLFASMSNEVQTFNTISLENANMLFFQLKLKSGFRFFISLTDAKIIRKISLNYMARVQHGFTAVIWYHNSNGLKLMTLN